MIIDIDKAEIEALAERMGGTRAHLEAAMARAKKKTHAFIRTEVKRAVARKERMPQKALGNRFFISRDGEDEGWIGTQDVAPFAVGTPTQSATGVSVAGRDYRGAFLGTIYTPREKVWIRLKSPHYSPDLYPTKKQHHAGYKGNLSASQFHRFPVVKAAIPIGDTVASVMDKKDREITAEFFKKLKQELNYEVFVKGM